MTAQDLRRIAFVTSRFHDLQGLRLVVLGVGILVGLAVWRTAVSHVLPGMSIVVGMMVTMWFALPFVDRRYRRAIGRALAGGQSPALSQTPTLVLIYGTLMADVAVHGGIFSRAPGAGPSLAGLALVVIAIWILVRDGAPRLHYLLGVLGGGLAVWVTTRAPIDSRGEALASAYALVALTVVGLGVLDHRQLMMAMPRRTDQTGSSEMASGPAAEKTEP